MDIEMALAQFEGNVPGFSFGQLERKVIKFSSDFYEGSITFHRKLKELKFSLKFLETRKKCQNINFFS